MPSLAIHSERLHAHRTTAALFHRCVPTGNVPECIRYRTSRWRNGTAPDPLYDLTLVLQSIGPDEGAELIAYLEDVYEAEHGSECPDLRTAMQREAEADAAEDEMQVRAAMDPAALPELIARSRHQEAAGRALRRAAMAEHQRRTADPRRQPRRSYTVTHSERTA